MKTSTRKEKENKEKENSIMAKNQKHFLPSGKEHKGATHKDEKGRLMSGAKHTKNSKYLTHRKPKGTA